MGKDDQSFTGNVLTSFKKDMKKSGMKISTSGKKTTITDPKTKKKIEITDTGKNLKMKAFSGNRPVGKEKVSRGGPDDIKKHIDWAKKKDEI